MMGLVVGLPGRGFCYALRERASGREKIGRECSRGGRERERERHLMKERMDTEKVLEN